MKNKEPVKPHLIKKDKVFEEAKQKEEFLNKKRNDWERVKKHPGKGAKGSVGSR